MKTVAIFEPCIDIILKVHIYPYTSSALDSGANKLPSLLK